MRRTTTRRELLRLGAGAALGMGGARLLAACGGGGWTAPDLCTGAAASSTSTVHAARGLDLVATTRQAIDAMGGMGKVVSSGDRVFIKPNMVSLPFATSTYDPFRCGECTKAEVVVAAAEACLEAGAAEVIIGDGSQQAEFDWSWARYLDGSTSLPAEAARLSTAHGRPVTLACLDHDSPDWIEVPTALSFRQVAISSLVMEADKVISIPVAKTHQWGFLTLAIKNFIGTIPLAPYCHGQDGRVDRWQLHEHDPGARAFNRLPQDIAAAVQPDLAIIDFSFGIEGNGPTLYSGGATVDVRQRLGSWLVLASTDLVAADATAARIMSQDERRIEQVLASAREAGLGNMCADRIELSGGALDELRMPWRAAEVVAW